MEIVNEASDKPQTVSAKTIGDLEQQMELQSLADSAGLEKMVDLERPWEEVEDNPSSPDSSQATCLEVLESGSWMTRKPTPVV